MTAKWTRLAGVAMAVGLGCGLASAVDWDVTLTVAERVGAARQDEPVTMGVPLPCGKVDDVRKLFLVDAAGQEAPCQFTETARWLDGKSVKWALLNFKASVPAKGKAVFTLKLGEAGRTPKTGLTAVQAGDTITVNTGYVKFTVRGKNFDGFHEAWFDAGGNGEFTAANQVIAATDKAGCVSVSGGKDYRSALDGEGKVTLERQGPMEVVVKAEGSHKNAAGDKLFDYVVRFYAYAGSPVVRVSHTFQCCQGEKATDFFPMQALEFAVPTKLGGGQALAGVEDGKSVSGKTVGALQRTSDEMIVTADGKKAATCKGKTTKPLSTGWISVADGRLGLAAGIRWFWQMQPKKLAVEDGGLLRLSLFPRDELRSGDAEQDKHIQQPFDVVMGQSRTHYVTFLFHAGLPADKLAKFFTGTQMPLMAWAPPAYYCRETACVGYVAESDKALFADDVWPKIQAYDDKLLESIKYITGKIDGCTYQNYTTDSYGFYAWGDVFHWAWADQGRSPKNTFEWHLSWEGNYYEFPHACLVQFLRTGQWEFLDRFIPHAIHVGDVFTVHHNPESHLIGACRYCPPRNFCASDDGQIYASLEFNHNKSQCIFTLYYLTGDLRALDNCKLLANNALTNHDADNAKQARGPGHHIIALCQTYLMWPTEQNRARLKQMVDITANRMARNDKSLGDKWMWGIPFGALVYYMWIAPEDTKTFDKIKAGVDLMANKAADSSNMALVNAYLYGATGDQKYRDLAIKALGRSQVARRPKAFGAEWHNTGFATYFLSNAVKPGQFKPMMGAK